MSFGSPPLRTNCLRSVCSASFEGQPLGVLAEIFQRLRGPRRSREPRKKNLRSMQFSRSSRSRHPSGEIRSCVCVRRASPSKVARCVSLAFDRAHRFAVYIFARCADVLMRRLIWRRLLNQLIKQLPLERMLLFPDSGGTPCPNSNAAIPWEQSDALRVESQLFNYLRQFPVGLAVSDGVAVVCSSPRYRVVQDIGEENYGRCSHSRRPLPGTGYDVSRPARLSFVKHSRRRRSAESGYDGVAKFATKSQSAWSLARAMCQRCDRELNSLHGD